MWEDMFFCRDPGRAPKIAGYFDDSKEMAYNREYRTFTGSVTGYDGKNKNINDFYRYRMSVNSNCGGRTY